MAMPRHRLRQLREDRRLTQQQLARAINVTDRSVRRWEQGAATPPPRAQRRLAQALDISVSEVVFALDGDALPIPQDLAVPSWLGVLAGWEQTASVLCAFEAVTVHGLLQTPAYAAAVEHADPGAPDEETVAERVKARIARQAVLDREPEPLHLSVVLDESILTRVAGDGHVMAEQLGHLIDAGRNHPSVDLRVLPRDAGVFPFGPFQLFKADPSAPPFTVVVENKIDADYLQLGEEIVAHTAVFDQLMERALGLAASLDLIESTMKEYL